MSPVLNKTHVNGIDLASFEWNEPVEGCPSLIFVHATGFHARLWDALIEQLPGVHAIAVDQRGHGRSDKTPIGRWDVFGKDLAGLIEARGLTRLIGVGHSMGGHALVEAAAQTGAFDQLLLIDPVIAARGDYVDTPADAIFDGTIFPLSKRKGTFASPDAMKEALRPKASYPKFQSRIFDDYCDYGLERGEDGLYHLLCPPASEASVYLGSRSNAQVFDAVHALDIPVHIMRAHYDDTAEMFTFENSPTWPGLVDEFPTATETYYPDHTHFLPMEDPDEVVRTLRGMIKAQTS